MKSILILTSFICISFSTIGQAFNNGQLIEVKENKEVYLVINQSLHEVPSDKTLNDLFIKNRKISSVSRVSLEVLPKAMPLSNAKLIKGSSSAIFLQFDGFKIHIPDPPTFNHFSFDWNKVQEVSDNFLRMSETLTPISSVMEINTHRHLAPCGTKD